MVTGCGGPTKESVEEEPEIVTIEEIWLIDEHEYHDIPLTSKAEEQEEEAEHEAEHEAEEEAEAEREREEELAEQEYEEEMMEEAYEIATMEALAEYEAMESTIVVTEIVIPLDETETVIAYNKKGEENAALQVVSDGATGEIKQITFMDWGMDQFGGFT